jgi:putative transposase
VRFACLEQQRKEFPVQLLCEILKVSRSGYYDWRERPASPQQQRRRQLLEQIRRVHERSRQIYGSPRIHAELKAAGVACCENTVAMLMKSGRIRSKLRRRFVVQTTDSRHACPIAPNLLERSFQQTTPNTVWVADLTYVQTQEGWLYLAAVLDLCSRKIVGWAMAEHMRAELCCDALNMGLRQRRPGAELLHHSDRGVQYACEEYQTLLAEHGIEVSMSRRGDCYDNAVMESFFGTLKTEQVYHNSYTTREEARQSIFEYIEVFYNRQRRHSALGYQSPEAFEASLG